MKMPASVQPGQIPGYASAWSEKPHVTLLLETGSSRQFSADDRAADLALRMLHAWRYGVHRMALDHPWTTQEDPKQPYLPDPLLPVWDNMALRLAGRRIVGELPLGNHMHAWILNGPDGGALAVWASSESSPSADLYLGEDPVAIDIWGNRSRLSAKEGKHHLQAMTVPTLIEGVDINLLLLRSAFALDNPFIPAQLTRHRRMLSVHNPWPITITGRLRITGPEGWRIQPGLHDLTIASGATVAVPLDMSFPLSETQGTKPLTAQLMLEADRSHTVDLQAPMAIGLEHLELRPRLIFEPRDTGAEDLVVIAEITNTSERAESLYVFAAAPGLQRQQRLVSPLGPGQTAIKRFRFPAAGKSLSGQDIRVGIRAIDGPALLNDVLSVP